MHLLFQGNTLCIKLMQIYRFSHKVVNFSNQLMNIFDWVLYKFLGLSVDICLMFLLFAQQNHRNVSRIFSLVWHSLCGFFLRCFCFSMNSFAKKISSFAPRHTTLHLHAKKTVRRIDRNWNSIGLVSKWEVHVYRNF